MLLIVYVKMALLKTIQEIAEEITSQHHVNVRMEVPGSQKADLVPEGLEGAEGDLVLIQKLLVAHVKMAQLKMTPEAVEEITNRYHVNVKTAIPGKHKVDPEMEEGATGKDEKAVKIMYILYPNFTMIGRIMHLLKIVKKLNQLCL